MSRPIAAAARVRPATGDPRAAIRAQALALGFDAVGFAPAHLADATRRRLQDFLSRGYHGDMGWMEAKADRRGDPQVLWPDAKSIVVVGLSYAPERDPRETSGRACAGNISVYARGDDYHEVLKAKLRALAQWTQASLGGDVKLFVDTAPVMEKPLAEAAGIGWQGKHTNLVSREHGSWLFLGALFTTLDLAPDAPEADHCGTCQACLDACPTNAFPSPRVLDARRCISYLTIEHKGPIDRDLRPLIGNRIYGCDDCLAACPWNKFAEAGHEAAFHAREGLGAPLLADLVALDDQAFRRKFAKSPIKRIRRDRFVRNVLVAIGNSGRAELAPSAERLLGDQAPLVRAMAVWALSRLLPAEAFATCRAEHLPGEPDAAVRDEWTQD
ncbi:MAG: tRNA epoxyqueuosine(34) reductase QueG [Alphaproteobacteria bacterium]|nr:tRNA epoxyqueuosine(34) reductase QueG [Alphaproteobacteria bacterium]